MVLYFVVFHAVCLRVDFVHCGQEPLGERVLLCKQIKLSSSLGQGVKNAIAAKVPTKDSSSILNKNPSMENRLLLLVFAFTSSIFCLQWAFAAIIS